MSEDATGSPDGVEGAAPEGGVQPEQVAEQGYEQQAYDQQAYDQQAYDQQAYEQQGFDAAAQPEAQQAYDPAAQQGVFDEQPYDAAQQQAQAMEPTPGAEAALTVEGGQSQPPPVVEEPQQKPKKRKIDLKSRLSGVRATGGLGSSSSTGDRQSADPLSFPPPPATGSVPAPALPAGIAAPMVSSPFAPPEVEKKPTAQQQTIKVEMGEEVHAARKKGRKATFLIAGLAALIFGAVGFGMGVTFKGGENKRQAKEHAGTVATKAEEANKTVSDMSDALRKAEESLVNDEFPSDLGEYLKTTAVGFEAKSKQVKGLPSTAFHLYLEYNTGVEKLNKQKDKVRGLLEGTKKDITIYFKTKKKKEIKFAVVLGQVGKQKKHVAEFLLIKKPFPEEGDWPAEFSVAKGKKDLKVNLFKPKGKLVGGDKPTAFVVTPKTSEKYTKGGQMALQLRAAILGMKEMIDGKDHPRPELQIDGVLKDGKDLIDALKKIQQAK